jgi:GntR family transcriptional regulator
MSNTPAFSVFLSESSRTPDVGLVLENTSFVPFYEQISEHIRALIHAGKLVTGQSYYSEGEIARSLGISKMPVRQAFQKLRAEGLLIIARGKRPVIGTGRVSWNFQELRGFSEEMRRRGLVPSAKLLGFEMLEPELEVAEALKLAPRENVYRIKRLRFVNAEPVAVVTSYLPAKIFPGIDRQDLENQSLYGVMENTYKRKLQRAEEIIGAIKAGEKDAHLLQTEPDSALLIIRETTYDEEDVAIEYSVSLLRGDRYTASVISVRKPARLAERPQPGSTALRTGEYLPPSV